MSEPTDDTQGSMFHNALTTAASTATDLATGIPIPAEVKCNFLKALGQLCTAAIGVPIAYLQGKAAEHQGKAAEQTAESDARVRLIQTGAGQIAAQMSVPESYVRAAGQKFAHRVVREQQNLDAVTAEMAKNVQQDAQKTPPKGEVPPISDDWLNHFEGHARQASSDEMRKHFGKVLAKEVQSPGSFSVRAVKALAELDRRAATVFQRLCSLAISIRSPTHLIDARVSSLGGNAGQNALQEYGLNFDQLNLLQEHELIISDYNSYMDYRAAVADQATRTVPLGFLYRGQHYGLLSDKPASGRDPVKLHGVALSNTGKQLLGIVDLEPDSDVVVAYTNALTKYLGSMGFALAEVRNESSNTSQT